MLLLAPRSLLHITPYAVSSYCLLHSANLQLSLTITKTIAMRRRRLSSKSVLNNLVNNSLDKWTSPLGLVHAPIHNNNLDNAKGEIVRLRSRCCVKMRMDTHVPVFIRLMVVNVAKSSA